MARLTERNEGGGITVRDMSAVLEKLAELEDAQEQGRLAILPFTAGDTLYCLEIGFWETKIIEEEIVSVSPRIFRWGKIGEQFEIQTTRNGWRRLHFYSEIGRYIFLTREEAETALKKRVTRKPY